MKHLSKETWANWILFSLFAVMVFIKCCMGHFYMHHSILVSSFWKNPLYFWSFYMPKAAISILFGSCVFVFRNKCWTIALSLFVDIWIWANIIYHRVYDGVIDGYVILMANNLKGFTSSIISLIEWKDSLIFLLTVVLILSIFILRKWSKCDLLTGVSVFIFSCFLWAGASNLNFYRYEIFSKHEPIQKIAPIGVFTNPFSQSTRLTIAGTAPAYDYSVLHMFFFAMNDIIHITIGTEDKPEITEQELVIINSLQGNQFYVQNEHKLILILFESLEDWVVQPEFMPNTYRLINSNHSFHAHKLRKQTYSGSSADGQMMANTGMLPIDRGSVCFSYPFNKFPSLPKNRAVTLLPHPIDVWNQKCMSPAYGYDTTIVTNECEAFCMTANLLQTGYDMVQIVTMNSHEPFGAGSSSTLRLPKDMPDMMADYIRCVNVTDESIGYLIDSLDYANILESTTIFITGDHTIFHKERRDKFYSFCQAHNKDYGVEGAFCPLIIYSPYIDGQLECHEEAYQMDVFPTIIELLGYDNYYWKGFGVNLMDSTAIQHRPFSDKEASELSNKMIRNDYFGTMK